MGDRTPRAVARGGRYLVSEALGDKRSAYAEHVGKTILIGKEYSRYYAILIFEPDDTGWVEFRLQKTDLGLLDEVPEGDHHPFSPIAEVKNGSSLANSF